MEVDFFFNEVIGSNSEPCYARSSGSELYPLTGHYLLYLGCLTPPRLGFQRSADNLPKQWRPRVSGMGETCGECRADVCKSVYVLQYLPVYWSVSTPVSSPVLLSTCRRQ